MANQGPVTGRSLSVRQLTFIFFLGVFVCAVFFSFGYVLGRNQSASREAQSVEQVAPRSEIPPTVNPPAPGSQPPASSVATSSGPGASNVIEQDLKGAGETAPPPVASSRTAERATNPVQIPSPNPEAASAPDRAPAPRGIMVQVAASRTEVHARSLIRKLRERGFRAVLIAPRGSSIYRVQVGPFRSRQQAMEAARKLRREGFRPFVRQD
jgi:cell division septation protein DedD